MGCAVCMGLRRSHQHVQMSCTSMKVDSSLKVAWAQLSSLRLVSPYTRKKEKNTFHTHIGLIIQSNDSRSSISYVGHPWWHLCQKMIHCSEAWRRQWYLKISFRSSPQQMLIDWRAPLEIRRQIGRGAPLGIRKQISRGAPPLEMWRQDGQGAPPLEMRRQDIKGYKTQILVRRLGEILHLEPKSEGRITRRDLTK